MFLSSSLNLKRSPLAGDVRYMPTARISTNKRISQAPPSIPSVYTGIDEKLYLYKHYSSLNGDNQAKFLDKPLTWTDNSTLHNVSYRQQGLGYEDHQRFSDYRQ